MTYSSVSNETIGDLFTKIPDKGDLLLDFLVENFWGREQVLWNRIEKAFSINPKLISIITITQEEIVVEWFLKQ